MWLYIEKRGFLVASPMPSLLSLQPRTGRIERLWWCDPFFCRGLDSDWVKILYFVDQRIVQDTDLSGKSTAKVNLQLQGPKTRPEKLTENISSQALKKHNSLIPNFFFSSLEFSPFRQKTSIFQSSFPCGRMGFLQGNLNSKQLLKLSVTVAANQALIGVNQGAVMTQSGGHAQLGSSPSVGLRLNWGAPPHWGRISVGMRPQVKGLSMF